jgi:hypothetical protein
LQTDKVPICMRLLSLGDQPQPPAEARGAVQAELMRSAGGLPRSAPLPGPLHDLRLPSGHTDALRMLWVQVC